MTALLASVAIDTPPAAAADYRRTGWGRVILLSVILFTAAGLRLVLTPLQEPAKLDLHFTDLQMGIIQGFAKGLPIALFALPIGLAIDHANRARLLFFLAICWTAGTAWTAFAHDFNSLFLARGLVGLGSGSAVAVAMSMIADLCMPEKRGRVLVLAGVGPWAGVAIAFALGGALFGYFNQHPLALVPGLAAWRQATLAFAVFGAVMLIPTALLREPKRYEVEQRTRAVMPALRGMWKRRHFLGALFFGQMAGGMAEGASGIWAAPVLTRNFGLQPNDFGGWMGGLILVSGVLGSVIGGWVADWGNNSSRRGGILIGAIVATLFIIPASAYPSMPSVPLFALALGTLLTGCTVTQLIGATAVTVLVPNEERGVCIAVLGVIGTLVGLASAPLVALMGSEWFGGEQHLGAALSTMGVAAGAVSMIGYVLAMIAAPARPAVASA